MRQSTAKEKYPQKRSKIGDLEPARPSSAKLLAPLALSSLLASSATQAAIIYTELEVTLNMPAQPAINQNNHANISVDLLGDNANDIKLLAYNNRTGSKIDSEIRQLSMIDPTGGVTLNFFKGTGSSFTKFAKRETIVGDNKNVSGHFMNFVPSNDDGSKNSGNFWPDPLVAGGMLTGYLGFTADPTSGQVVNGWIKVQVRLDDRSANLPEYIKLLGMAYEEGGLAINAGQIQGGYIPEASHTATGLGLLALGAAAVLKRRKARKAKKLSQNPS